MDRFVLVDNTCASEIDGREYEMRELGAAGYEAFGAAVKQWSDALLRLERYDAGDEERAAVRTASLAVLRAILPEVKRAGKGTDLEIWASDLSLRKVRALIDKQNELNGISSKKN